jgi:hypothetical protein
MTSLIFCTLKNGEYDDRWLSEPDSSNVRSLHWCGQRKNQGNKDRFVGPGTLVAVRSSPSSRHFILVGHVLTKKLLTEKTPQTAATYELSVSLETQPVQIDRAEGDRCVHWTVLRHLNIPHSGGYLPEGIYSA